MPDAARLASTLMAARPKGVPYMKYALQWPPLPTIAPTIESDIGNDCYAAALSYADAINGLKIGNSSWAVIKLYYSAFYSMRAMLMMDYIIPFFYDGYYLCDARNGVVKKSGNSSHDWKWSSIREFKRLSGWYYSEDSTIAYDNLKEHRINANYTFAFIDPNWHSCFAQAASAGIAKSFRTYRDDIDFLYTYLADHVVLAYPTKLVVTLGMRLSDMGLRINAERDRHLQKIWPFKDKTPLR